jgi:ABC-2 type transport system permease protein
MTAAGDGGVVLLLAGGVCQRRHAGRLDVSTDDQLCDDRADVDAAGGEPPIFNFGWMLREGQIAIDLLRPLDFQTRFYVDAVGNLFLSLLLKAPLLIVAVVFFQVQLPRDVATWLVFGVALVLGHGVMFFFDWIFACLAFYSTETWGLSVVRVAVVTFFSGAIVPLQMMPPWLQAVSYALPFAQSVYVPVSFLSGVTPLSAAPQAWLTQAAWLIGLGVMARLVFKRSVRKITVQGG